MYIVLLRTCVDICVVHAQDTGQPWVRLHLESLRRRMLAIDGDIALLFRLDGCQPERLDLVIFNLDMKVRSAKYYNDFSPFSL